MIPKNTAPTAPLPGFQSQLWVPLGKFVTFLPTLNGQSANGASLIGFL